MAEHADPGDTLGHGWRRMPNRPASSPALSREAYAAAALEFIDENDFESLTLRALGDRMGVHYTALYRHFRNKDELIEAVLAHMLATSDVSIPEKGTPRERILGLMRTLRAAFAKHPRMALPNLTEQDEQATAALVHAGLTLLEDMGLQGRDLMVAYQMLETFSVGSNAYDFVGYPEGVERRMRGRRLVGHPATDEAARSLDTMQAINDEAFEVAAGALLDACEAMAARGAQPR